MRCPRGTRCEVESNIRVVVLLPLASGRYLQDFKQSPDLERKVLMSIRVQICLSVFIFSLVAAGCRSGNSVGDRQAVNSVVYESVSDYTAWPAGVRLRDGSIVVYFTLTDEHMGPDGRIVEVRSTDDGVSWSEPRTVYDTPIDERESGITLLADGSLLLHVWSTRHSRASYGAMADGSYPARIVDRWVETVEEEAYRSAPTAGGQILHSVDGGETWEGPAPGPDTIHGGIQLADGRILVASYRTTRDYVEVYAAQDWRGPWDVVAELHSPDPDSIRLGEPSVAQLSSGRIVVMMRATTKPYNDSDDRCYLYVSYSDDNGLSWSSPVATELWGFPPHLLALDDGRLLVSYGHRRAPFGQRAAVSADGITWRKRDEVVLRDDAPNVDLGYPASVQLSDGRILTVYYQSHPSDTLRPPEGPLPSRHKPDILATTWSL